MYVIGIDIGGTKCGVLLCQVEETQITFLRRVEIPTKGTWQTVLNQVSNLGEAMLQEFQVMREDCCIGISCGGPLNLERTLICSPPNLPGWDQVPVVEYLTSRLGMPARMQNDADACALAEWKYGAGIGTKHMIFLTFGTGLGAGLILNGHLYTGASGCAGEVGHIRMTPKGPIGYGKAGSLEGYCSGGGISQLAQLHAKEMKQVGRKASFDQWKHSVITAKDVAKAAYEGKTDAKEIFACSGTYFGHGLSVLLDILNPEVIVVGSIYARSRELLDETMWKTIVAEALPGNVAACKILPAKLGEQIGDYGAVMAAIYD